MRNKRRGNGGKVRAIAYFICLTMVVGIFPPLVSVQATEMPESSSTFLPETGDGTVSNNQIQINSYIDLEDDTLPEDRNRVITIAPFSLETSSNSQEDIPAAYRSDRVETSDGGTISYLPSAFRNQYPYGTCWSFSALGACEASMIRKGLATGSFDLSERHLLYYFYNKGNTSDTKAGTVGDYNEVFPVTGNYLVQGGNNALTMWHLASWCGPVAESVAPYSGLVENQNADMSGLLGQSNSTKMAYEMDACHVQNIYKIAMGNMEDKIAQKQTVKKLIMEYGALTISYSAQQSYAYDSLTNNSYYNYDCNYAQTNHAVLVVGWDDDFPKEKFVSTAPGNGAWLVKNNWGDEGGAWAQNGYFWLSYYDKAINQAPTENATMPYAYVYDAESADNYDNICQYDGDSATVMVSLPVVSNRFVAGDGLGKGEILKAVGIGVAESGVSCDVEIYKNLTSPDNDPTSGEKVHSQSVYLEYPGYHTIPLNKEIELPDGCQYSVVFRFATDTSVYVSCDMSLSFVDIVTEENHGVSFYSFGGAWSDCTNNSTPFVLRIKAYTDWGQVSTNKEPSTPSDGGDDCGTGGSGKDDCGTDGTGDSGSSGSDDAGKDDDKDDDSGDGGSSGSDDAGKNDDKEDDSGDGKDDKEDDDEILPAILTKLKLNKTKVSLVSGKSMQLVATPTYSKGKATEWKVYWKSSDASVVKVNSYGKITARNPGRATITVYNGKIKATCTVTVKPKKTSFSSLSLLSSGNVKLKWKKSDGVTGYVIYRATSPNGTYKKVKTIKGANKLTVTLKGFTGSTPYYYKIRAYKTISGKNVYGEYSGVRTCGPDKVSGVKAKAYSGKKIRLTWGKTGKASGYVIYRATQKNGKYTKIETITGTKTLTFTNKSLKKGKNYYYKIRAYRTIKGKKIYGPYSGIVSVKAK